MAVSVLAVSASAWGVLMGLSPVLQIRRMLRERSSREVSLGYFAILLAGFLLWISYGIAAGNVWLVVPNSIALLVGLTLVAVALRLRHGLSRLRLAEHGGEPIPDLGRGPVGRGVPDRGAEDLHLHVAVVPGRRHRRRNRPEVDAPVA
jgi:MtN3 and saliva related transmembrane protein